jgi:CheY-like chemotaxis protein
MVHGIMHDHDGTVQLESARGEGTVVRCLFPALGDISTTEQIEPRSEPLAGRGQRILFVDDEPSLVMVGKRRLEFVGYHVTTASTPADALALLRDPDQQFHLLITDYSMPGMDGLTFGTAAIALRPELPVVLLTGFIDEIAEQQLAASGIRRVLHKPVLTEELAEACEAVLNPR